MTESEKYTKALAEGDVATLSAMRQAIPDTPVEMIEMALLIQMGGYTDEIFSQVILSIAELFGLKESCISKISYPFLKKGYYPIEMPIYGKRTIKELCDNEIEKILSLPFCGVTNIYFTIADGSMLHCNRSNIPSEQDWEQLFKIYQEKTL
jgi:hypothetical protein